jgi:predicted lipoprotein with Yx(FWY)xxD motif
MPEEGLETAELKEALEGANEHAHGAHPAHGGGEHKPGEPWIVQLSLSTAIIAVLAAIAALQSGSYANQALADKNDSILAQSRASDLWTYYQAKGIKSIVYQTQAEALPDTKAETIAKFKEQGNKQIEDQKELEKQAREQEKIVKEKDESSELLFHKHHQFALSVTVFQVTIAMAAIAALTRRRPIWLVSLAVSLAGIWFFVQGYLAAHA